jgi:hypothetical protein
MCHQKGEKAGTWDRFSDLLRVMHTDHIISVG